MEPDARRQRGENLETVIMEDELKEENSSTLFTNREIEILSKYTHWQPYLQSTDFLDEDPQRSYSCSWCTGCDCYGCNCFACESSYFDSEYIDME